VAGEQHLEQLTSAWSNSPPALRKPQVSRIIGSHAILDARVANAADLRASNVTMSPIAHRSWFTSSFLALVLGGSVASSGCAKDAASTAATSPSTISAAAVPAITGAVTPDQAVAALDRTADDKALDAGRKPAELLSFLKVGAGMKVAELFAGGGYTVELLARVVGPTGVVYGQNTKAILEMFAEKPWSARLARLASPSIVRVDRDLVDPLPPEALGLDLVVMHLVYHDTVWLGVDRAAMNGAILKALKPGGEFVIIDHSGKDGSGSAGAKDLHRIEAKFVQTEVEKAGFVLDRSSDMFKHPEDTRDWNASPMAAADKRGTTDRFVMVFKKPAAK
jgi:predicted methyltransferase